jgi:putative Mg2+ transporter-C (MgtC) family protein
MDFATWAEDAFHTEIGFLNMLARLTAAAVFGLIIGLDREYKDHPAGMRTHMLVSLASATFTVLTFEVVARTFGGPTQSDPVRVIGAVTAGVAFLAAGTIIQGRRGVQGLTTGAGMWLAGAIGLACGIGAFGVALTVTLLGMFIMTLLAWVTPYMPKKKNGDEDVPARPAARARKRG